MTMTDPIADMLTRIRNAFRVSHDSVDIPSSKLKISIAKVLKTEGYIKNFRLISIDNQKFVRIFLRYDQRGVSVIEGIKKVSKPSCRVYAGYDEIPKVMNGYGINIISTSKGLMTDREARKMRLGGEVLCLVW